MNQRSTVKVKFGCWILQLFRPINDIKLITFSHTTMLLHRLPRLRWTLLIFLLRGKGKMSNLEFEFALLLHHKSIHCRHTMMILHTYITDDQKKTPFDFDIIRWKVKVIFGVLQFPHQGSIYLLNTVILCTWPNEDPILAWYICQL